MDPKIGFEKVRDVLACCEKLGIDPVANGLAGPDDLDAARKFLTKIYIVAHNLVDIGKHRKDKALEHLAEHLATSSAEALEAFLVTGLSEIFKPGPLIHLTGSQAVGSG